MIGIAVDDHCTGAAVTLHDVDPGRLRAVARILEAQARDHPRPPPVTVTTDVADAVRGADFVFSAIRVGGLAGRVADEAVAHAEGVPGQETVGAGGISYGLRTVPVAVDIARRNVLPALLADDDALAGDEEGRLFGVAVRALATHPLVDSVTVARRLLDGYRARFRELGYLT